MAVSARIGVGDVSAQQQDRQWVVEALEQMLDLARRGTVLNRTELTRELDLVDHPSGDGVSMTSSPSGIETWTMKLVVAQPGSGC